MKKEKQKEKQVYRKREEIIGDLKKNKVFQEKMKFAREVFYPALCQATKSIDDAQIFLGGFNTALMQEFLSLMKDKKMSDLSLESKLSGMSPEYKPVVSIFNDMTVFDAKDHIEGMKTEIQLFLTEENKSRKLSELHTKWLDQLDEK